MRVKNQLMKKILPVIALALAALTYRPSLGTEKSSGEEVLESYPHAQFKVDFEGNGTMDTLTVSCQKVRDYSVDPETGKKTSEKKLVWYHFHLKVISPSHQTLCEDEFSSKEEDYQELFEHFGKPFLKPADYLQKFLSMGFNGVEKRKIKKDDIDEDFWGQNIKNLKAKTTLKEVENEILKGKHTVIFYRGDWAEDLRQVVYSKKLRDSLGLNSPY